LHHVRTLHKLPPRGLVPANPLIPILVPPSSGQQGEVRDVAGAHEAEVGDVEGGDLSDTPVFGDRGGVTRRKICSRTWAA
jgi:hypothetical protein